MKDLNNVPQAQTILNTISRYQQVQKLPEGMFTGVKIETSRNSEVLLCAHNLGTNEMKLFTQAVHDTIANRIKALNETLGTL